MEVTGVVRQEGDCLIVTATVPLDEGERLHLHDGQFVALTVQDIDGELRLPLDWPSRLAQLHPVIRATAGALRPRLGRPAPLDDLLQNARADRAEQRLREG